MQKLKSATKSNENPGKFKILIYKLNAGKYISVNLQENEKIHEGK